MRCPSCGTDNAPDSRFCGGCGARQASSNQRVAPTEKISDDAPFPPRQLATGGAATPVTAPGVVAPRGIPSAVPATPFVPRNAPARPGAALAAPTSAAAPASAPSARPIASPSSPPPRASSVAADAHAIAAPLAREPSQPRPPQAPLDDPSLSLPIVARRPWGLIIVVLLIDIGLAAAGAWMLMQGLGERSSAVAPRPGAPAPATPPATPPARTVELTPIEPTAEPPPPVPPARSR